MYGPNRDSYLLFVGLSFEVYIIALNHIPRPVYNNLNEVKLTSCI